MADLQILRNLALLSTSATRQLVEDPVLLALQGARRLSEPWRGRSARALGIGAGEHELRRALSAFIADRPDSASDTLSRAVPSAAGSPPRWRSTSVPPSVGILTPRA